MTLLEIHTYWVISLTPVLAFCYWLGGRKFKWVRRWLGWAVVLMMTITSTGFPVGAFYLAATLIGYGETSVLVRMLGGDRLAAFGVVGLAFAVGPWLLGFWPAFLILPAAWAVLGGLSLKYDWFDWSGTEAMLGMLIAMCWGYAAL